MSDNQLHFLFRLGLFALIAVSANVYAYLGGAS